MRRAAPALIVLFAACRQAPVEPCPARQLVAQVAPASRPSPFDSAFRAAGAEFHVPPALLEGLGWVETRWAVLSMPPAVPAPAGAIRAAAAFSTRAAR